MVTHVDVDVQQLWRDYRGEPTTDLRNQLVELYLPLLAGACIELVPRETATNGADLAHLLETSGANVLQATTATWRLLVEVGWREVIVRRFEDQRDESQPELRNVQDFCCGQRPHNRTLVRAYNDHPVFLTLALSNRFRLRCANVITIRGQPTGSSVKRLGLPSSDSRLIMDCA